VTRERWAWVDVDLEAIRHNAVVLASMLDGGCRLMAVVKADGYGHGAVPAARVALEAGAAALGVATVDEALQLRSAGVEAPILVMAEVPPEAARDLVEHDVAATVTDRPLAMALAAAAQTANRPAGFHLKIDTGMHRIGIDSDDAGEFLRSLTGLPGLRLDGVFTHFATAETPGDWEFDHQLGTFREALSDVREAGFDPGIVHAANSAATILHPEARFDMVRCGISLYGLHPGPATRDAIDLRPAMSVKARVTAVRKVAMGDGVSYGFTWRAAAPTTVATIPMGYGDGLHRVLSDRMRVLIRGSECPQVGRVCMDQFMVEVPRGSDVAVGDEVVLVGEQQGARVELDELADAAGTINYEMACGFALRLRRVHR
jgi:alanine racemase